MNSSDLIQRIKPLELSLRARGMEALYLFGSMARGEADAHSDVDLMCDLDISRSLSLIDFAKLNFEIEDHLGLKVDLCERQALRPRIRAYAESEKVRIF
jgi:uncharacterized protein